MKTGRPAEIHIELFGTFATADFGLFSVGEKSSLFAVSANLARTERNNWSNCLILSHFVFRNVMFLKTK